MKIGCPKCKEIFDSKERVCPKCGYEFTEKQLKRRKLAMKLMYASFAFLAAVVFLVIFAPEPEKPVQDAPKEPIAAVSQENDAAQGKSAEESAKDNPFTRKVKNQAGREWVMMEVYPGVAWDSKYFFKKLGPSDSFDPEEFNPKIVKMFYYPDIDMTLIVNLNKNEVMAWRDGKATK